MIQLYLVALAPQTYQVRINTFRCTQIHTIFVPFFPPSGFDNPSRNESSKVGTLRRGGYERSCLECGEPVRLSTPPEWYPPVLRLCVLSNHVMHTRPKTMYRTKWPWTVVCIRNVSSVRVGLGAVSFGLSFYPTLSVT